MRYRRLRKRVTECENPCDEPDECENPCDEAPDECDPCGDKERALRFKCLKLSCMFACDTNSEYVLELARDFYSFVTEE